MRIILDMQGAQSPGSRNRGIGRYSLSLAKAIVRNRGKHEIILALNGLFPETVEPIRAAFEGLLPQSNIRVWYVPGPVSSLNIENDWRRHVAELTREAFLASLKPDIVLITSLFEGLVDDTVTSINTLSCTVPVAVILYDLIPLIHRHPYLENPATETWYENKIDHLRRAEMLLAISESSRKEGILNLGFPLEASINISTAAESHFQPLLIDTIQTTKLLQRFGLTRSFVMYTGGIEYRKNIEGLIRAYARLPESLRKEHQLAVVGSTQPTDRKRLWDLANEHGLSCNEVVFPGFVQEEDLIALYNLCKVFVFPSWHEGFGLPALEAMSCGRAVIGANTTSLPEVIGRKDALFDPHSDEAIAEKLTQVLIDDAFRHELERHGLLQARKFSWDKTANQAIAAFENWYARQAKLATSKVDATDISALVKAIAQIEFAPNDPPAYQSLASCIAHSLPPRLASRQLLVDISELVQRDSKSGIQRVVRSILREWLEFPPIGWRVEPVYALHGEGYHYARRFTAGFLGSPTKDTTDDPIEYQAGDLFLGLDLQHYVALAQQEFYQRMRRDGAEVWFVVYDLLPILMPQAFREGIAQLHKEWLDVVVQSDGAVCISKAVANELSGWFEENAPQRLRSFKIGWFHLGADIKNSVPSWGLSDDADAVIKKISERASFLMVGTIEPRKGHAQTLDAFEQLWAQGVEVNLVIVGQQGWHVEALIKKLRQHPKLSEHLFWLEGISDEYLEKVYAVSTCLIAASEGEGFGLPLIEAAQHKLPIIARDIPVFREVAAEYAVYFAGEEPLALAEAIKNWLALDSEGKAPQSIGMPYLTWRESAQNLLNEVLSEKAY